MEYPDTSRKALSWLNFLSTYFLQTCKDDVILNKASTSRESRVSEAIESIYEDHINVCVRRNCWLLDQL